MANDLSAYRTPGALIRAAREARGMTVDDLAAETRIPDRLLTAMEQDDFDRLSGALYARSFLRNCAQALGLDPADLLDAYERMLTEQAPEVPADQTWETETAVQRVGGVPWKTVALGAGGLVLLVLLVWGGIAIFGDGEDEAPSSGPVAEQTTRPDTGEGGGGAESGRDETPDRAASDEATDDRTQDDQATDERRPTDTEPPASTPIEEDTPTRDEPAVVEPVVEEAPIVRADDAGDEDAAALPVGDGRLVFAGGETWPLVLRVVLDARVDLAVGSDGDREARPVPWPDRPVYGVPAEDVVPGRVYTVGGRHVAYWGAADHFLLRLSSADGVSVTLNGRPLDIPPRSVGREWVLDRTRLAP